MEAYVYNFDGKYKKITELLISLKYKCSIDKPAQEVTFQIPYGVYSDAFPSFNILYPISLLVALYKAI